MAVALNMTNRFNSIDYFDQLRKTGIKEDQARIIVNLVDNATHSSTNTLITQDHLDSRLAQLEMKIERRFNSLLLAVIVSILIPIALHFIGH